MTQETPEKLTEAELDYMRKARNRLIEAQGHLDNLAVHMGATRSNESLAYCNLNMFVNMADSLRTPIHNLRVLITKQGYISDSDSDDTKDTAPAAPVTVTTVEELNALPVGAVIKDRWGTVYLKGPKNMWVDGEGYYMRSNVLIAMCPATVIYRPDEQGAA